MSDPELLELAEKAEEDAVYLVIGDNHSMDSDGDVVAAFYSESVAREFIAACKEYDATQPPYPMVEDINTPEASALFAAYFPKARAWRGGHPAESSYMDYEVRPIVVRQSFVPAEAEIGRAMQ